MTLSVSVAESTELFVGPVHAPLQLVRVGIIDATEPTPIHVAGTGLVTVGLTMAPVGDGVVEVPVAVTAPEPGKRRAATIIAGTTTVAFTFVDAEPGRTGTCSPYPGAR
jgi:alpha-mannosidase